MAYVLIGFMGAGKSTAATELAQTLGAAAADSDSLLAERFGHPVAREFELAGEEAFRAAEEELVVALLERAGDEDVIALGGGSVLSARVRAALTAHVTVYLDIDAADAWQRVGGDGVAIERPLARDRDAFTALHTSRRALYEGLADVYLPGGSSRPGAQALLGALRLVARAPTGTRLLWAAAASGEYPVLIGSGVLAVGETAARLWPLPRERSGAFLVTDTNVGPLYAQRLGSLRATVAIAPGEGAKTIATAERVWAELLAAGMTRADHVVGLGGGVVGDLAGFCAATYQRGVPVVHVPTTLVAQVDSAYGGKTGVDLPQAKNYVGAYHQPAGVLVDPDTLATLPAPELAAGWVEVLKTALIAGGPLWDRVAAGSERDQQTILECARTKLAIVARDERDAGARQALNLGHTVGHAIEAATGYACYRHGEAVGIGLLAALRLSALDELRAQVREMLIARELPVTFAGADVDAVLAAMGRDKKRVGDTLPFVLLRGPGAVEVGCEVPDADVRAAVAELAS
jgi:shikimate kinase/3-dehydroquinate synthase